MQNIAIENLKRAAVDLFVAVDTANQDTRKSIAKWNNPDYRKKYSAEYLKDEAEQIRQKAKEIASIKRADLQGLAARLEVSRKAWDTSTLMKRARFVPENDKIEADLLEELKRLRIGAEVQSATVAELAEMAVEAKDSKNLAMLQMIKKEAARRTFGTDVDSSATKVAINKAVDEVDIPEQQQALAFIDEIQATVEAAEDVLVELMTGKETKRAEAKRIGVQYVARQSKGDDDKTDR
jgi:hypothetical protein